MTGILEKGKSLRPGIEDDIHECFVMDRLNVRFWGFQPDHIWVQAHVVNALGAERGDVWRNGSRWKMPL